MKETSVCLSSMQLWYYICCRLVCRFAIGRVLRVPTPPAFGRRAKACREESLLLDSHARARPAVMDANVRAAAAETLRLCREAGHDVSPAVAALHVQAQRLAKVHPNDLVAHCAAKLAAAGDPALETLNADGRRVDARAARARRRRDPPRARDARGALEREVADTVVDAATVSGRAERLLLDRLHARAFEYVFVSAGLEPLLRDRPTPPAGRRARRVRVRVPQARRAPFFALPSAERAAALRGSPGGGRRARVWKRAGSGRAVPRPVRGGGGGGERGGGRPLPRCLDAKRSPARSARPRAGVRGGERATRRDVAARLASAERSAASTRSWSSTSARPRCRAIAAAQGADGRAEQPARVRGRAAAAAGRVRPRSRDGPR